VSAISSSKISNFLIVHLSHSETVMFSLYFAVEIKIVLKKVC